MRAFSATAAARMIEEDITTARLGELIAAQQGGKVLLVDFYADWCQPCKMLSPVLHRLATTPSLLDGREIDLVTIDVDKNQEAAGAFQVRARRCRTHQIRAMPTVLAFKDAELANKFVGVLPESQIKKFITDA
ncbi:hypothetical protein MSPP1_001412 [Malassezia sp. CBS 17886]|nr:hypothetical protein MSPP1_001412 [Malassezia sp. CBS 17886]